MESSGTQCCGTKGKRCGMIFKLVLLGILTCIASSLWGIEKSIGRLAPTAAAKP